MIELASVSQLDVVSLAKVTALVTLSFVLGIALLILLRCIGKFSAELDRIGSDLNLYGYGIGLSFLFAIEAGRPVLRFFAPTWIPLILCTALMGTLLLYGLNLYLSERIRGLNRWRYSGGIDSWEHLSEVLEQKTGKFLFKTSLALGFFPTFFLILLDILGGK